MADRPAGSPVLRLGRGLINAKPQPYGCELDEGQVVSRELVVPVLVRQLEYAALSFAKVKKATKIIWTAIQFGFDLSVLSFPDWQRLSQHASPLRCEDQPARTAVLGVDSDLEKATPLERFEICGNGRSVHCQQRRDASDSRGIRLIQRHQECKLSVCESNALQRIVEATRNQARGSLQVQAQARVAHLQRCLK
jgi:hypothetical protein